MDRLRKHLPDISGLDDAAVLHHEEPVADMMDHPEVMGDEQQRHPEAALQGGEQIEYLGLDRHVERGDRFVTDDHIR